MLYLGRSWWFSLCHVILCGPSLHGPTSISLLWLYKGNICVPHWCWLVAPITWDFNGYKNPVSGLLKVDFPLFRRATWPFLPWTHLNFSPIIKQRLLLCPTLVFAGSTHYLGLYWLVKTLLSGLLIVVFAMSRHATCPFPPWTHLNFSVMTIQRLYLCSTLVLGGSTHYLELYWLVTTLLSGPLMVVFTLSRCATSPSLHGPTSISLLWLYKGYICVPHWCWVVAPITWDFVGCWKPYVLTGHGGFHPVTSCYLALPSRDPPQFLCYDYTKAIFVFFIGVGW
jgi:hypothetical protein